ncbi:type II secretion system F family protein [Streptomyces sp. NPDC060194]|uniref:type II secretion system F family protein n=1 Tax=Streptomyces sp. NPDC060194 TaxID=3347069 RepID=UPI0036601E42
MSSTVTSAAVCAAALWAASTAWSGARRERAARRRAEAVLLEVLRERRRARMELTFVRAATPVAAGLVAGWVMVGGPVAGLVGAAAGWWLHRWARDRRDAAEPAAEAAEAGRQLPLAADLLAACVAAGAGPVAAAEAVGQSLGGPVGRRLVRVAAEVRLGGDPAEAWAGLGALPGAGALARCLERAAASGAPAADAVARIADDCRAEAARAAETRAQRAGVLVTAPVGLCFLPAFLVIGVAPVVLGLASGLKGV